MNFHSYVIKCMQFTYCTFLDQHSVCMVVLLCAFIFDYLLIHVLSLQAHVSKLSWVLQECVHCVARDFLTMRDLLHYGRHISSFRSVTRHCSMFCEHACAQIAAGTNN